MYTRLPNLELLLYKAKIFLEAIDEEYADVEFDAYVFPQTWGSTALGLGGYGGQAITKAYTTVFTDVMSNIAVVFFGDSLAYTLTDLNEAFMKDLAEQHMVSMNEARSKYVTKLQN